MLTALMAVGSAQAADTIADDFESYTAGSGLLGIGIWSTWDEEPTVDGVVSTEQAASGTQSLKISTGNDVIANLGKTRGRWEVSCKVFIPTDHTGTSFFILLNQYAAGGDKAWALQLEMRGTTEITASIPAGAFTAPPVLGEWSEIRVGVDLVANTQTVYYNDVPLLLGAVWAGSMSHDLAAIDFYNEGSPVYYDDLLVRPLPATDTSWTAAKVSIGNEYNQGVSFRGTTTELDGCEGGLVVSGTGGDIWSNSDSFYYVYDDEVKLSGDFDAQVLLKNWDMNGNVRCDWARAGFMARASSAPDAPYAFVGVNGNNDVLSYSRDTTPAFVELNNGYKAVLPIWLRLARSGSVFSFYWKKNEGDEWTLLQTHDRGANIPQDLHFGFGVQNHGGCVTNSPADATFCNLQITNQGAAVPIAPAPVEGVFYNLKAMTASEGALLRLGVGDDPGGLINYLVVERTMDGITEGDIFPGVVRAGLDPEAFSSGPIVYKVTAFDELGYVVGMKSERMVWGNGIQEDGNIANWVLSPRLKLDFDGYATTYAQGTQDFLSNADGSVNETNIVPTVAAGTLDPLIAPEPTVFSPDFNGAAASIASVCGGRNDCDLGAAGLSFMPAWRWDGDSNIDFNRYFGESVDWVMIYMVAYVTNNTGSTQIVKFNFTSDDSFTIMIDNVVYNHYTYCCGGEGYGVLPPGEHRLLAKCFNGGGGFNARLKITHEDGTPFAPGELRVAMMPSTGFEIPVTPPMFVSVPDGETVYYDGPAYPYSVRVGPAPNTPVLLLGWPTPAVEVLEPAGGTYSDGLLSIPFPSPIPPSFSVTLRATNSGGSADVTWTVNVIDIGTAVATAEELFVDLDAADVDPSDDAVWPNNGSLADFDKIVAKDGVSGPVVHSDFGVPAVQFSAGPVTAYAQSDGNAPAGVIGNGSRTIEVWAMTTLVTDQDNPLVTWGQRGGSADGDACREDLSFRYSSSGCCGAVNHWCDDLGWNGAPVAGQWHHLVYTYDGGTVRVYADGELKNQRGIGLETANTHPIVIGAQQWWDNPNDWTSRASLSISKVRVHDGVLDARAILHNYRAELTAFDDPYFISAPTGGFFAEGDTEYVCRGIKAGGIPMPAVEVVSPAGATLADGVLTVTIPSPAPESFDVVVRATNSVGSVEKTWTVSSTLTPGVIAKAETLFVDLDVADVPAENTLVWPNRGALGEFNAVTDGGIVEVVAGVTALTFGLDAYKCVDKAPRGIAGPDPTRSVEAWAYNPVIDGEEGIISWGRRGGPDGTNFSFGYGTHADWGAVGMWGGPDFGWGAVPAAGIWHHLVYTYDGLTSRAYVDGVQTNSETLWPGAVNTHELKEILLGAQWENNGLDITPWSTLSLGKVRVHDGVLHPAQIQHNWLTECTSFGYAEPAFLDAPTADTVRFDAAYTVLLRVQASAGAMTVAALEPAGAVVTQVEADLFQLDYTLPEPPPNSFDVIVRVTNVLGSAEAAWPVTVLKPPVVAIEPAGPIELTLCEPSVGAEFTAIASDPNEDPLTYEWSTTGGELTASETSAIVVFDTVGVYDVTIAVSDGTFEAVTATVQVNVLECPGTPLFIGDANIDAQVDIADAICILGYLFGPETDGCKSPKCLAGMDTNNSDAVDIADAIRVLSWLFAGGDMIAPDGTLLGANDSGCNRYQTADFTLPCDTPCTLE